MKHPVVIIFVSLPLLAGEHGPINATTRPMHKSMIPIVVVTNLIEVIIFPFVSLYVALLLGPQPR